MDEVINLNSLKRQIFSEFLNLVGRAYLLVSHSEGVILGKRGFTQAEKENGIILAFNSKMNVLWDDHGVTATLVFGATPQRCFIPADDIRVVYSPELNAQFVASPLPEKSSQMAQESPKVPDRVGKATGSDRGDRRDKGRTVRRGRTVSEGKQGDREGRSPGVIDGPQNIIRVDFRNKKKDTPDV